VQHEWDDDGLGIGIEFKAVAGRYAETWTSGVECQDAETASSEVLWGGRGTIKNREIESRNDQGGRSTHIRGAKREKGPAQRDSKPAYKSGLQIKPGRGVMIRRTGLTERRYRGRRISKI